MTPQQRLAERMYELLPHKKELDFGCIVRYRATGEVEQWYGTRYSKTPGRKKAKEETAKSNIRITERDTSWKQKTIHGLSDDKHYPFIDFYSIGIWNGRYAEISRYGNGVDEIKYLEVEVIGQPLRLADVLLCLSSKMVPLPELDLFSLQLDISIRGSNGRNNCLYDLSKDNILDQSDKFCNFVLDLLK